MASSDMAKRGAHGKQVAKGGRPYFSASLVRQIEALYEENTDMGELDLTEFAQNAARFYLEHLEKQQLRKAILRLANEGKLTSEAISRLFPSEALD